MSVVLVIYVFRFSEVVSVIKSFSADVGVTDLSVSVSKIEQLVGQIAILLPISSS